MRAICAVLLFIQIPLNAATMRDLPDNFFSADAKTQIAVVNDVTAKKFFQEIVSSKFSWGLSESANLARAHFIVRSAEKRGLKLGKIFVEGNLNYRPNKQGWPEKMSRRSHAAVVIYVQHDRQTTLTVLDPLLNAGPLTVDEWKAHLQIAKENSNPRIARVSTGSRFQYAPNDSPKKSYADEDIIKMESTMKALLALNSAK